jgi:Glucanosyltransferase
MVVILGTRGTGFRCMQLFKDAHIYVMVDFDGSNDLRFWRNGEPAIEWDNALLGLYKDIYDNFQGHSNTLGFRIRLRDKTEEELKVIPRKKAFIRDVKEYARSKGYRSIPIGADGYDTDAKSIFEYMNCGDADTTVDFYTLNVGGSLPPDPDQNSVHLSLNPSPEYFAELRERYHRPSVPILLRYGYSTGINHTFDEVQAIYDNPMTEVFSGVIFEQWFDQKRRKEKDTGKVLVISMHV